MLEIVDVKTPAELESFKFLLREYIRFLGEDLSFQNVEEEFSQLPGLYAPPKGALLLARDGEEPLGCGALRPFGAEEKRICELKRIYIRPQVQGLGIGQRLVEMLIERGRKMHYATILLDTLDRLGMAVRLYEHLGFERIEPYYPNPLAGVSFWMLDLYSCSPYGGQYFE